MSGLWYLEWHNLRVIGLLQCESDVLYQCELEPRGRYEILHVFKVASPVALSLLAHVMKDELKRSS